MKPYQVARLQRFCKAFALRQNGGRQDIGLCIPYHTKRVYYETRYKQRPLNLTLDKKK